MYAVIESGGKQYRVSPGETVEVDLLAAQPGDEVALDRVLLVSSDAGVVVGKPVVADARVVGRVVREGRGPKIIVFKYASKKRYRRTQGHRQDYTYIAITDIQANGQSLVPDADRVRLDERAQRAANRFETKLMASLGMYEEIVDEARATANVLEPAATATETTPRSRGRGRAATSASESVEAPTPEE